MKNKKIHFLIILIILVSFGLAIYLYPEMPDEMASHWNALGEPNGYMNKTWALFLMPVITVFIHLMLIIVPGLDPLKKNIERFRMWFDGFSLMMVVFFFYLYFLTLVYNVGFIFNFSKAILPAMGVFFLFIGNMLQYAKRNWFIGVRTPWTLSSDRVWDKTHLLASKLFIAAGIITIIAVLFSKYSFIISLISILSAAFVPVIYSYFEYKRLKK